MFQIRHFKRNVTNSFSAVTDTIASTSTCSTSISNTPYKFREADEDCSLPVKGSG